MDDFWYCKCNCLTKETHQAKWATLIERKTKKVKTTVPKKHRKRRKQIEEVVEEEEDESSDNEPTVVIPRVRYDKERNQIVLENDVLGKG